MTFFVQLDDIVDNKDLKLELRKLKTINVNNCLRCF